VPSARPSAVSARHSTSPSSGAVPDAHTPVTPSAGSSTVWPSGTGCAAATDCDTGTAHNAQ